MSRCGNTMASYPCFVLSCNVAFRTRSGRRRHLITKHQLHPSGRQATEQERQAVRRSGGRQKAKNDQTHTSDSGVSDQAPSEPLVAAPLADSDVTGLTFEDISDAETDLEWQELQVEPFTTPIQSTPRRAGGGKPIYMFQRNPFNVNSHDLLRKIQDNPKASAVQLADMMAKERGLSRQKERRLRGRITDMLHGKRSLGKEIRKFANPKPENDADWKQFGEAVLKMID